MLLPRGSLSGAPADLSAAPRSAAAWLTRRARESGWPVLDATCADGMGRPLLSFLMVGNKYNLQFEPYRFLPAPKLPWEVVVRELTVPANAAGVAAAWNDALLAAQGE